MGEKHDPIELATLVKQLVELASLTNRHLAAMLQDLGLSASEGGTLWALAEASAPVPMREIARRLGCDPSNVTIISDKLEAAGLIERRPNPRDARARVLILTDDGRELWSRVQTRLARDSPIATLTVADRRQLSRLLTTMSTHD
jgi:DNA-binding MarR family transcriptional regulator